MILPCREIQRRLEHGSQQPSFRNASTGDAILNKAQPSHSPLREPLPHFPGKALHSTPNPHTDACTHKSATPKATSCLETPPLVPSPQQMGALINKTALAGSSPLPSTKYLRETSQRPPPPPREDARKPPLLAPSKSPMHPPISPRPPRPPGARHTPCSTAPSTAYHLFRYPPRQEEVAAAPMPPRGARAVVRPERSCKPPPPRTFTAKHPRDRPSAKGEAPGHQPRHPALSPFSAPAARAPSPTTPRRSLCSPLRSEVDRPAEPKPPAQKRGGTPGRAERS